MLALENSLHLSLIGLFLFLESGPLLTAVGSRPLLPAVGSRPLLPAVGSRPLLPAVGSRPLLPAVGGRSLLASHDARPLLASLDARPLLASLDARPILPALEQCEYLSKETEICSHSQKRKRVDLQEASEFVPARTREETLAVRPQKSRKRSAKEHQRTELFDPGQPDADLDPEELQKLIEHDQEEISDPGEPNFLDPRELLKDLNFGEMKAGDLEAEIIRNLQMEFIKGQADGNLEIEAEGDLEIEADGDLEAEADGDLEAEADGDLEAEADGDLEDCIYEPLFPPEVLFLHQDEVIDIELDDAEEDAPNAAVPNEGGNWPPHRNGRCQDGETDMEEVERQKDEEYPEEMQEFVAWLFSGVLLFIIIGNVLNILSYVYDWRGLRTQNTTIPVTDTIYNVTTSMTTIFNESSSDFDTTTSMNDDFELD